MELNSVAFDNEELFHLALKAMENGQSEQAILLLKRLLNNEPEHGRAHYLLGALHAEIGMYSRAIEEMRHAVELEPDMPTAHFQLGLLYATSGMATEAEKAWSALDGRGEEDPLYIFKRGLTHLIHDEFEASRDDLNRGIQLNQANPALNNDMQRILGLVSQKQDDATKVAPAETGSVASGGKHILLNAYQNNEYGEDSGN